MTKKQAALRLVITKRLREERVIREAQSFTKDCTLALASYPGSKREAKSGKMERKQDVSEKYSRHLWQGAPLPSMRFPKAGNNVSVGVKTWHKIKEPVFTPLSMESKAMISGGFCYAGKMAIRQRIIERTQPSKAFTIWL